MLKVISHEPIASGLLNIGYSSAGTTALKVWDEVLTNTDATLSLLVARLEGDYVALAPKMRKQYKQSDIESWSFTAENQC